MDQIMDRFYDILRSLMHVHISQCERYHGKSSLPWLTGACREALARKHATEGMHIYESVAAECREVLPNEKHKYSDKLRDKLAALPQASKKWWSISKQILHQQKAQSFFPH